MVKHLSSVDFQSIAPANLVNATAANVKADGIQAAGSLAVPAAADHVHPLSSASISAALGSITTSETLIVKLPIVSANIQAGSVFQAILMGTYTNTNISATNTFTIRAGTLGTTSDASLGTIAGTSFGSAVSSKQIKFDILITVTATGSSGTANATEWHSQSTASYDINAVSSFGMSSLTGWNTTTATFLDLTWKCSASNSLVVQQAFIQQVH